MLFIFLDVDGVLNTVKSSRIFGRQYIDDSLVRIVVSIIKATAAKIILSSNWRLNPSDVNLVKTALSRHGLDIFDFTPVLEPTGDDEFVFRSKEIQSWIDANDSIHRFAIIDDDPRANIDGSFFQTDERIGLTGETASLVIAHLKSI